MKALTPDPSHGLNMALCRAHEVLQRDYEVLRLDHDSLLLKHNDSVHACLVLLEKLKEKQTPLEPSGGLVASGSMADPSRYGRGKATWKQPPPEAAIDTCSRDASPAAEWQRQPPWPQPGFPAHDVPALERRSSDELDELCSEEDAEREEDSKQGSEQGSKQGSEQGAGSGSYPGDCEQECEPHECSETDDGGGDYGYDDGDYADEGGGHYADEGDGDDELISRADAMHFLEDLALQKQLVKELQGQVGQLTADLSRKCEREGALVIHVSPELW